MNLGDAAKQFILFEGKRIQYLIFFRLSLSLLCEKFLERNRAPKFINKEHAKFKSLMCLCMKTHQEVGGLGLPARRSLGTGEKVIHRLGVAGCCGYVVSYNCKVHWIIFSSFNFACYGP